MCLFPDIKGLNIDFFFSSSLSDTWEHLFNFKLFTSPHPPPRGGKHQEWIIIISQYLFDSAAYCTLQHQKSMDGLLLLVVLTHSVYKPNLFYLWWEKGNLWIHFTKQFLSLCSMPLWWIHSCFEEKWRNTESLRLRSTFRQACFVVIYVHLPILLWGI